VNKESNTAVFETKHSLPKSSFLLTLPLYMNKVPVMSQKLSILTQKLEPKCWDLVSASWVDSDCHLERLNETECTLTCTNLGIFAIEYNSGLFVCGDGVRDLTEACDDWNNANGDGCDTFCQVEDGWKCSISAEKLGFDKCQRVPCHAPYNCRSRGICLPDSSCFCDSGFFGDTCSQNIPIYFQRVVNYTWSQLPFFVSSEVDNDNQQIFVLTVNKDGNMNMSINGSTVAAGITIYEPEVFPVRTVRLDASPYMENKFETAFLSKIFEVRLKSAGNIIVNATGRIFLTYNFSLRPPFLNFSLSNTNGWSSKNGANVTIQIFLCKYSVFNRTWQPITDSKNSDFQRSRVAYDFHAVGPNYYALIAATENVTLEVDVSLEQRVQVDPEHSFEASVFAGIAGAILLIAAVVAFWYIRRRNRRRMILAAYYQASVAAARKNQLKKAAVTEQHQSHSIPQPPESEATGPSRKQHQRRAVVQLPSKVAAIAQDPPPAPLGLSSEKMLVAAAIRSKFKHSDSLNRSLPALKLQNDLGFEVESMESESFVSQHSYIISEDAEIDCNTIEVESIDSDDGCERQLLDASSSCSGISMVDDSDPSDLEDAGIATPIGLPLNDFEDDADMVRPPVQRKNAKPNFQRTVFPNSITTADSTQKTSTRLTQNFTASRASVGFSARQQSLTNDTRQDAFLKSELWKQQNSASFDA
jgi:cysteine-rich repeat protein